MMKAVYNQSAIDRVLNNYCRFDKVFFFEVTIICAFLKGWSNENFFYR